MDEQTQWGVERNRRLLKSSAKKGGRKPKKTRGRGLPQGPEIRTNSRPRERPVNRKKGGKDEWTAGARKCRLLEGKR